ARVEAATLAEKIWALTDGACRWPVGDPRHPDFHFCARPAAEGQSYCEPHRAMACMVPPASSGHGATERPATGRLGQLGGIASQGEFHRAFSPLIVLP